MHSEAALPRPPRRGHIEELHDDISAGSGGTGPRTIVEDGNGALQAPLGAGEPESRGRPGVCS